MKHQHKGIAAVLLSAFLFGVTSNFSKLTYSMGNNPLMLVFFESVISLPVLYFILKRKGIPLRLSRKEAPAVLGVGLFGLAPTRVLLASGYAYIPAGLAVVLHFSYPAIVMVASILLFKDKMSISKLLVLVLSTAGVAMIFFEGAVTAAALGFVLALASAFTYAVYILAIARTSLKEMHYFKMSFYFSVSTTFLAAVCALATGSVTFGLSPLAWAYVVVISILVSVVAFSLFQYGVVSCGATTASILSALEPITGVLIGIVVFGERLNLWKLSGCAAILTSMVLVTVLHDRVSPPRREKTPPFHKSSNETRR